MLLNFTPVTLSLLKKSGFSSSHVENMFVMIIGYIDNSFISKVILKLFLLKKKEDKKRKKEEQENAESPSNAQLIAKPICCLKGAVACYVSCSEEPA